MQQFGPPVLFTFTSVVHVLLIIATAWRMFARAGVPKDARGSYHPLLRTSLSFSRMANRTTAHEEYNIQKIDTVNGRQAKNN